MASEQPILHVIVTSVENSSIDSISEERQAMLVVGRFRLKQLTLPGKVIGALGGRLLGLWGYAENRYRFSMAHLQSIKGPKNKAFKAGSFSIAIAVFQKQLSS